MYIFKNAFRSISRSKGRNILIGIIALTIALSACIALSIKESAVKLRKDTLSSMEITAQISFDRQAAMSKQKENGEFDREAMKDALLKSSSLTLEEYQKYAKAEGVRGFYYTISSSLDAGTNLEPVDTKGTFFREDDENSEDTKQKNGNSQGAGGGSPMPFGGKIGMMGAQGDFTVIGYSSDKAMTDFTSGKAAIKSGSVFSENTTEKVCIVSDELATYNSLKAGDEITLLNPNDETEEITLKVVGIYSITEEESSQGGFSTAQDSANRIMMSYAALKSIVDASSEGATETTDEDTGVTSSSAVTGQLSATYVFQGKQDYDDFCDEVKKMGLADDYTVSSNDITSFEQSLVPLENLSEMADYFLLVVLGIGAVILIVLNIFNIRERKYEIGVLTAIGMKKGKVALQFITEIFAVTLIAVVIGAAAGAVTSVPVTNALLEGQISSNKQTNENIASGFGREFGEGIGGGATDKGSLSAPEGFGKPGNMPSMDKGDISSFMGKTQNYISEVSYSTDLTVIIKLVAIGVGLTLISAFSSVLFIMRYEPLKILSGRD